MPSVHIRFYGSGQTSRVGSGQYDIFSLFLSLLALLVLSFLAFLVFPFISFPFSFFAFFSPLLFFSFLFFSLFLFPIDLRLSCVCVIIGMYYVQYIRGSFSWVASGI